MNKILFITAGVLFLAASCGKSAENTGVKSQEPLPLVNSAQQETRGQGSFKDLLAMGKPLVCDSSFSSEGNASTGTTYIAGGKIRGDFSSQVQGKTIQMHMIIMNQTTYSWIVDNGTTMAFKSPITQNDTNKINSASTSTANIDQQLSYNCHEWNVDNSMFTLPESVNFQELPLKSLNSTPKAIIPLVTGQNKAACAACNNAGTGKALCLASLRCE